MSRSQVKRPKLTTRSSGHDEDCTVLHVDMDAFYASVSLLERPQLRGRPVIVGGAAGRGVVLAASYEARELGVHSAMPMGRARRLAPQAVVVPPDFSRYTEVSQGVMALLRSLTPQVEVLGLDEAFLEVSGARRRLGGATRIAELIRARVHDEQGITCSVGVSATKFVAKLASTLSKPDGLLVVPPEEVVGFLHPLPVSALWGVGDRTEEVLLRMGLRTVGDIAATPQPTLERMLGPAGGAHLLDLAWGRDPRTVEVHEPDRSIGAEETFGTDVDDPQVVLAEVLRLSEKVAARMRKAGYVGRTVQLKVRFADFTTITRSRTLRQPTDTGRDVYNEARLLFQRLGLQRARLRLVGVRMSGLTEVERTPQQMAFDPVPGLNSGWRDVEQAVDLITERFGRGVVQPARLVEPPEIP
ncbi:MAG: DNA polymerase IV [Actinobacteria bacterium]|nr:DNA polymerase IV [Actinomycetota bacterium]